MKIISTLRILTILTLTFSGPALAESLYPLDKLIGQAFDIKSGELLYEEHHQFAYEDGRVVSAQVKYVSPAGEQIGQKQLDFRNSASLPAFRTELYGGRFIEGLDYTTDGKLKLYYQKDGEPLESKVINTRDNMTADAGFNNHVYKHYDELVSGDTVKFRITVPNHLTSVKFKAQRVGERELQGLNLVDFKISLDSLFGLFVDPLTVSYDTATKRLIEYVGLTNVRDESGELYEARIIYPQFLNQATASAQ